MLVSVIIATYNRERLLPRAVESLRKQSWADWEAVIIDDGSTDGTRLLVEDWCAADARFHHAWQPNGGLTAARNKGLALARGEVLTFLDSDDEYLPNHLSLRCDLFTRNPGVDFIHGGIQVVDGPDHVPDMHDPSRMIPLSECVVGGTFFLRRRVLDLLGGFQKPDYGNDNVYFHRVLDAGLQVRKVDYPTYVYHRGEPDSMCNQAGL